MTGRFFATTRQLTGKPRLHHGYAFNGNVVMASCLHGHRSHTTAQRCAEAMLRKVLREFRANA